MRDRSALTVHEEKSSSRVGVGALDLNEYDDSTRTEAKVQASPALASFMQHQGRLRPSTSHLLRSQNRDMMEGRLSDTPPPRLSAIVSLDPVEDQPQPRTRRQQLMLMRVRNGIRDLDEEEDIHEEMMQEYDSGHQVTVSPKQGGMQWSRGWA